MKRQHGNEEWMDENPSKKRKISKAAFGETKYVSSIPVIKCIFHPNSTTNPDYQTFTTIYAALNAVTLINRFLMPTSIIVLIAEYSNGELHDCECCGKELLCLINECNINYIKSNHSSILIDDKFYCADSVKCEIESCKNYCHCKIDCFCIDCEKRMCCKCISDYGCDLCQKEVCTNCSKNYGHSPVHAPFSYCDICYSAVCWKCEEYRLFYCKNCQDMQICKQCFLETGGYCDSCKQKSELRLSAH